MRFSTLSLAVSSFLVLSCGRHLDSSGAGGMKSEAARSNGGSVTVLDVDGAPAKIVRDEFGIPHIFAPTNRAVFVAYGFAVANDRLWQLETFRRSGRGTLAEILGPTFLPADRFSRLLGYTDEELDAQFHHLSAEERVLFNAYVEGINRYIQEVVVPDPSNKLPLEFQGSIGIPQPYTIRDLVSFLVLVVRQFGEIGGNEINNQMLLRDLIAQHGSEQGYGIFNDLRWLNDREAPASIPADRTVSGDGTSRSFEFPGRQLSSGVEGSFEALRHQALSLWERLGIPTRLGSYAWAVSPEKSANGHAMLYGGPQMGFNVPEIVHEVDLNSEENLHAVGLAVAGGPGVIIGHNRELAWSLTTGAAGDNVDIYAETLCPNGASYSYLGDCIAFERRVEVIRVLGSPPVEFEVLRTVHGPVVAVQAPLAFSQKRAHWMNEIATVSAFSGFDRASNLLEFKAQVERANLSFNVLYADRLGNIAYFFTGLNPVRPCGFDLRIPFPGDGSAEWTGEMRPNPFVINPPRGWLASWNNKPSVDYASGDTEPFGKIFRADDLFARLMGDQLISHADMEDIPKDIARVKGRTGRESRFLKPYLLVALDQVPPSHPLANQARSVVESWDGSAFLDAVGSTALLSGEIIFSRWLAKMLTNTFAAVLGAHSSEANSNLLLHALDFAFTGTSGVPPSRDFFEGKDPNALMSASFDQAVAELAAALGDDPSLWTASRDDIVFAHPIIGEIGRVPLSNRSTYGQVVILEDRIRGENIFTLGQSGFIRFVPPGFELDPHFRDLLPLYRNFEYKRMGLDDTP